MTLASVRDRMIRNLREELYLNADDASKRADEYIKFMQLKLSIPHFHWLHHMLLTKFGTVTSLTRFHISSCKQY
jgi:hypothetical protein